LLDTGWLEPNTKKATVISGVGEPLRYQVAVYVEIRRRQFRQNVRVQRNDILKSDFFGQPCTDSQGPSRLAWIDSIE
jgi:hypothetical protein